MGNRNVSNKWQKTLDNMYGEGSTQVSPSMQGKKYGTISTMKRNVSPGTIGAGIGAGIRNGAQDLLDFVESREAQAKVDGRLNPEFANQPSKQKFVVNALGQRVPAPSQGVRDMGIGLVKGAADALETVSSGLGFFPNAVSKKFQKGSESLAKQTYRKEAGEVGEFFGEDAPFYIGTAGVAATKFGAKQLPKVAKMLHKAERVAARNKWMGKSPLIDKSGEPISFYHGTGTTFKNFSTQSADDATKINKNTPWGEWSYFSTDPEYANVYAKTHGDVVKKHGQVHKVNINSKNIFDPDNAEHYNMYQRHVDKMVDKADARGLPGDVFRMHSNPADRTNGWESSEQAMMKSFLDENKFDAQWTYHNGKRNIFVANPNAIKSVNNPGKYSRNADTMKSALFGTGAVGAGSVYDNRSQ